jgi:hypothetical protein
MSLEIAKRNSQQTGSSDDKSASANSPYDNPDTEHIYIGDEFADQAGEPTTIRQREYLRNHVLRTITEVTFFEEGFLKIREGNEKSLLKEHVVELRFLDSDPVVSKRIATSWLWSLLGSGALALSSLVALPMAGFPGYATPVAGVLAVLAALSLAMFVYRTQVTHQFRTASGKAGVVSLTGSLGCIRRTRVMSFQVREAIARAGADSRVRDVRYLRAEMQAHYKLAETGVISREACSDGTALILSKFG